MVGFQNHILEFLKNFSNLKGEQNKMYNVAIIGCGRVSHKISEGIADNYPKMQLIALCDLIEDKIYETEKTYDKKLDKENQINKYTD